jgi:hypothetical protein
MTDRPVEHTTGDVTDGTIANQGTDQYTPRLGLQSNAAHDFVDELIYSLVKIWLIFHIDEGGNLLVHFFLVVPWLVPWLVSAAIWSKLTKSQ